MIKVAGVKYNNDPIDGGRDRQEILKELYEAGNSDYVEIIVEAAYIKRKDGTYGIKLMEHKTKEVIGWMHTETANKIVLSGNCPKYYIGYVSYHGSYHVKLDNIPKEKLDELMTNKYGNSEEKIS